MSWSRDEEAEYERPQRRTRPRTKNRPSHDDAEIGVVITIDRGRVTLQRAMKDGLRIVG